MFHSALSDASQTFDSALTDPSQDIHSTFTAHSQTFHSAITDPSQGVHSALISVSETRISEHLKNPCTKIDDFDHLRLLFGCGAPDSLKALI